MHEQEQARLHLNAASEIAASLFCWAVAILIDHVQKTSARKHIHPSRAEARD